MIKVYFTVILAAMVMSGHAQDFDHLPITADSGTQTEVFLDCDTVVGINGYTVRIIRDNGEDVFSGLCLFPNEIKESADRGILNRIETDLYKMVSGEDPTEGILTRIVKGKLTDFKTVTPETPCTVRTANARHITVEWSAEGKQLAVNIPVSYETPRGLNRTETENRLIANMKRSDGKRKPLDIRQDLLIPYGEDLHVLPGQCYLTEGVTNSIYLDTGLEPVWSASFPCESLANLFIVPSDIFGNARMELTVLKHEYGMKETISIPVCNLMAELEKEGCQAYWGVESITDSRLEGALFFFNPRQGYDHVLKIECQPEEVIKGTGKIMARGSLYIPANNVDNLNATYAGNPGKERIMYGK